MRFAVEVAEWQPQRVRRKLSVFMLQPDEIIRSQRKTLSISVDARGRLIVRAPLRCAKEKIAAFIAEKEGWILRKQAERKRVAIPLPPDDLEGYAFPLFGELTKIRLVEGKRVRYDGENELLYLPKDKPRERLTKWLKETALRILTAVTQTEAARMGVEYSSVKITSARTRWGSCSANNALRYTFRLLYCPKEIIQYVAVHELSHIRHKNHSPAFWAEVDKYIPDRKARRRWLKTHGNLMEIF